jgi:hypothetical protein
MVQTIEHLFSRTEPELNTGCILWYGGRSQRGYGRIVGPSGRMEQAHRISWELHFAPIPSGLQVLHKCDTPACINPAHLFLGTQQENVADMIRKGRRGPLTPPSNLTRRTKKPRLTADAVVHIRRREMSGDEYAALYGVHRAHIANVQAGKYSQRFDHRTL